MKTSDTLLLSLNALLILFSMLGIASTEGEVLIVGAMLAMVTAAANGAVLIRRRRSERAARRDRSRAAEADEMDVHRVLDLDARLEALERAQHDAVDAARWRALVDSGQVSAPADLGPEAGRRASAVRNGV